LSTITAEDRRAMVESVHRLLSEKHSEAIVRRAMETASGIDPDSWKQLIELGLPGLIIAQEHDGLGGGAVEAEAVMEEAGAALLGAPLLSGWMAAVLIAATGDAAAQARLLPEIARGRVATVALTGDTGAWTQDSVAITAKAHGNGWNLDGHASFVLHGQNAQMLLAAARTGDGFGVFELVHDAAGLSVSTLPTFDRTLRLARLVFDKTPAVRLGSAGWDAVQRMLDFTLVALAGEQAGGAKKVLDFTTKYAQDRIQFGRPIGSFQAIKHMAANLLLETESAISVARAAAAALEAGSREADELVALAAFTCADAYNKVTADAIQMHGGIAFTWAHPAHLYLRRARADKQLFGSSDLHRERYLKALGA
jgi:alkylation response protein AidB-like acyl-CoA dehydrogenase